MNRESGGSVVGRVHEGWLEKEGSWMKSWKNRYCILDTDKQLSYYTDQNLTEKKGVVDLNMMSQHKEREDPNKMQFGFEILCSDRHWFFKTSSRQESIEWIGAITRCTDNEERTTRLNWSVGDKIEVFSQSKDMWCLGYIKRVDHHVVYVSYSVGEGPSDQLTKEVRVFDAMIRKPSEATLKRDEERKKKLAADKQAQLEEEATKKAEAEKKKQQEAEEQERARERQQEEQSKAAANEEEQLKRAEQDAKKKVEEETRKANGGCPAYDGMTITGYWRDTKNPAHNGWYGATIERMNEQDDGSFLFDIIFDDGHRRANCEPEDIKDIAEWLEKNKKEKAASAVNAQQTEREMEAAFQASVSGQEYNIILYRQAATTSYYWQWGTDGDKKQAPHANTITVKTGSTINFKWQGEGTKGFYLRDMTDSERPTISDGGEGSSKWVPKKWDSTSINLEIWKKADQAAAKKARKKEAFTLTVASSDMSQNQD